MMLCPLIDPKTGEVQQAPGATTLALQSMGSQDQEKRNEARLFNLTQGAVLAVVLVYWTWCCLVKKN
jgi:hypothetical protein